MAKAYRKWIRALSGGMPWSCLPARLLVHQAPTIPCTDLTIFSLFLLRLRVVGPLKPLFLRETHFPKKNFSAIAHRAPWLGPGATQQKRTTRDKRLSLSLSSLQSLFFSLSVVRFSPSFRLERAWPLHSLHCVLF